VVEPILNALFLISAPTCPMTFSSIATLWASQIDGLRSLPRSSRIPTIRNGAVTSAVLVHQTRGSAPLRLAERWFSSRRPTTEVADLLFRTAANLRRGVLRLLAAKLPSVLHTSANFFKIAIQNRAVKAYDYVNAMKQLKVLPR
jgi:hypothetical protein